MQCFFKCQVLRPLPSSSNGGGGGGEDTVPGSKSYKHSVRDK